MGPTGLPHETIQDVKWFFTLRVVDKRGDVVHVADGPLCWGCGCTAEVWPLESHESIIARYNNPLEEDFQKTFMSVKERLTRVISREFGLDACKRTQTMALEVYQEYAFVLETVFSKRWSTPKALGVKVTKMPGFNGSSISGVLFERHNFPADIAHFIVKVSAQRLLELEHTVLAAKDIVRMEQARDTFSSRLKREVGSRATCLRGDGSTKAHVSSDIDVLHKEHEAKVNAQNSTRQMQLLATDQAALAGKQWQSVKRVRHGQLSDSDDDEASRDDGARGTRGGAAGRGRGSATRRGSAPKRSGASGSSSARSMAGGAVRCPSAILGSDPGMGDIGNGSVAPVVLGMDVPGKCMGKKKRLEDATEDDYRKILMGQRNVGYIRRGVQTSVAPLALPPFFCLKSASCTTIQKNGSG